MLLVPRLGFQLLLPVMSMAEKVNQLLHVWTTVRDADVLRVYGNTSVGAMYMAHLATNLTCDASPVCRLAARNRLQKSLMEQSAHHIPISFVTESLHSPMMAKSSRGTTPCEKAIAAACPKLTGVACKACVAKHSAAITAACPTPGQVDEACGAEAGHVMGSIFPMPAGQGATWNRSMVRAVAAAIAAESRASGADRGFSPELQVATDPRFGRTQENFGGDPYLVSELGVAATLGLHGGDTGGPGGYLPDYTTTITSEAKHYAVYGFGDADGSPADVSIPTLYDVYLRPWKAYVQAGGRGVMAAHNTVNGVLDIWLHFDRSVTSLVVLAVALLTIPKSRSGLMASSTYSCMLPSAWPTLCKVRALRWHAHRWVVCDAMANTLLQCRPPVPQLQVVADRRPQDRAGLRQVPDRDRLPRH